MSWRFRESFQVFPGIRINVSKSGVSTTLGAGPLHVNIGPNGIVGTASIPGTGISCRVPIDKGKRSQSETYAPATPPGGWPDPVPAGAAEDPYALREIRSASTYEMTSSGLSDFRNLINAAQNERNQIDDALPPANLAAALATAQFNSWQKGFFLRRIRPKRFAELEFQMNETWAFVEELLEQRHQTTVVTEIAVEETQIPHFGRLCDAFASLTSVARIWDTVATKKADQFRERTLAVQNLDRRPVALEFGLLDILSCEWQVPCFRNANGGDMFLYPGFLVYHINRNAFATISFDDLEVEFETSHFIESDAVPSDTEIISHTWLKTNKDGSPDRRFRGNCQIPVCAYAKVSLKSGGGLNEQYLVSNVAVAKAFCSELNACIQSFRSNAG
jgi:hypothetical protein